MVPPLFTIGGERGKNPSEFSSVGKIYVPTKNCLQTPSATAGHRALGKGQKMAKALVIVESPAKARTINKFLGPDYVVEASMGHVMDLPKKEMGVDVEHDFQPNYVVIPKNRKVVTKLKKEAKDKDRVYLAPDPDREGEAISWHLSQLLGGDGVKIYRVSFNEITKEAVEEAFSHPGAIDLTKVYAQQARRILDRLVGYSLSPLLWDKVGRGLSAGRVQSVAVRLICEREKEIKAFRPEEYWSISAKLKKQLQATSYQLSEKDREPFIARIEEIEGKKAEIKSKEQADLIVSALKKERFLVDSVETKEKKRHPAPPFTTSKLQQEAYSRLHFLAYKTMRVAQQLYEGIEIGKEGSVGLITYMRTDSVRVSEQAIEECRKYIKRKFGPKYLPRAPKRYKPGKLAQLAHEAIRPTLVKRTPESIAKFLSSDQFKLYQLIWNKFVASQMNPAIVSVTSCDIKAAQYLFRATGTTVLFDGFTVIYPDQAKDGEILPALKEGEILELLEVSPAQHFTKAPARYSDGSLVKVLEESGIGRPSTYAPIIYTILSRDYIRRSNGALFPTELGMVVTGLLIRHFPKILDVRFTADMEAELDQIEEGRRDWIDVLRTFYDPFIQDLIKAKEGMKDIKKEAVPTSEVCEKCGRMMVIKWGPHGRFLACSGFPDCKNTKPITTGVPCPQPGCNGELIERRSRKGRVFYGCSNYPNCKYVSKKLPQVEEEELENKSE